MKAKIENNIILYTDSNLIVNAIPNDSIITARIERITQYEPDSTNCTTELVITGRLYISDGCIFLDISKKYNRDYIHISSTGRIEDGAIIHNIENIYKKF